MPRSPMPSGIVERMETVGDRIRTARVAAGLGNNELDRLIGRSSGYTSRLETGERTAPRAETLKKIAEATKVNFEWLAFGKGEMKDAPERVIVRDVPTYSEAEIYFADALAAGVDGVDEKVIASARMRLGRHRGDVTAKMAEEALREARENVARVRVALGEPEQKARVDALRRKS